jgi:hypothetical protein
VIFEAFDQLSVDVGELGRYFHDHVSRYQPVQGKAWGGWSILSATGDYRDGWQLGHTCYKTDEQGAVYLDHAMAAQIGFKPDQAHIHPTQVCTGYLHTLIDQIRGLGLEPCRARWTILRPHGKSAWHRDAPPHHYAVRLHIPVITNPLCRFVIDGEAEHIPADGRSHFVRVNQLHEVVNDSDEDRVHIIMNVTDRTGLSHYHRLGEAELEGNGMALVAKAKAET